MTTPTIAKSVLTDRNSVYKAKDVIEIFNRVSDSKIASSWSALLNASHKIGMSSIDF